MASHNLWIKQHTNQVNAIFVVYMPIGGSLGFRHVQGKSMLEFSK